MRFCVVGGGILGLATARLLLQQHPGAELLLLEKEPRVALHQTGRNSGVVHAGVYYEPGSLKARLCRHGAELLEAYCSANGLPWEACGKVVVALDAAELPRLSELHRRALANGVPGVRLLSATELRVIEPHATGVAALYSPSTAITDYGAIARQLARDVKATGGVVRCGAEVSRVLAGDPDDSAAAVELTDGTSFQADHVVVCAGLHADRLARASGAPSDPRIVPFRGEYFALRPERSNLVRGLIYPVPDPALPFLGIHLTRRVGGEVLVGPNAVLALGRESYRWRAVNRREVGELVRWNGTWRLLRRQWRAALTEVRRSASRQRFIAEAQRYLPELQPDDVVRAHAGVRAQAVDPSGALVDDFRLDVHGQVAWVRNAPSPAATSSLAIAEELLKRWAAPTR